MGDVAGLGSTEGGGIDVFQVNMADGSLELVRKKNGVPVIERPTDSATVALFP